MVDRIKIVIVDYGIGNIKSVATSFSQLGYNAEISNCEKDIKSSDAVVLPGVGAFAEAVSKLKENNLFDVCRQVVLEDKKPFLGICLGMQLIAETSEEGERNNSYTSDGLALFPGKVTRIPVTSEFRLPHIGWNNITIKITEPFLNNVQGDGCFYFVHSYHLECEEKYIAATVNYGGIEVVAAVQKDNIFATQFHPEKSQLNGLRLLRRFTEFVEQSQ